jgi:Ras homolog enriched in brain
MVMQFVDGTFNENYYPTIENSFNKIIKHKGSDYNTEIVDTAGQVCYAP